MKIILNDNSEIAVDSATYDGHYVINCDNAPAYQALWNRFTANNLSDFKLADDEDKVVLRVFYIRLKSTQAILNPDGTVTGHFYFDGGTVMPNEYEEAGRILLGEEEEQQSQEQQESSEPEVEEETE